MSGFENIIGVNPWTALFTFCNMLITFAVLKMFLFKPVKKMIDDRQNEIDSLYEDAGNAKKEALAMEEEYRLRLAEAGREREAILKDAVERGRQREKEIVDVARAEADAARAKARADIAQERKKAINELKNGISDMAVDIAAKVTEQEIDGEKHQALIEDFIRKMGDAS